MLFRFLLLLLAVSPAAAGVRLALTPGEQLTYRVAFGIFLNAGEIKVLAKTETDDNQACTLVVTTTSTRGLLRGLFPFDARAESVFSNRTGRMLVHTERSATGNKTGDTMLAFDFDQRTADFRDLVRPERNKVVNLPEGDPMDLITCLVQTRTWDLKPGEQRDVLVMFEDDPYELTLHALGYEKVHTPLGDFNTLVLQPMMEKTEPKGMFKRGSNVRVWISQDDQHLPVKFEVEFKFGIGVSTLTRYTPPPSPDAPPLP
ncbi:MAG: hypothetical protein JWM88_2316 [Verrucomicrobia bacterium]|nr:hypothetical protein [Verrucomicrobiota bacterium]